MERETMRDIERLQPNQGRRFMGFRRSAGGVFSGS